MRLWHTCFVLAILALLGVVDGVRFTFNYNGGRKFQYNYQRGGGGRYYHRQRSHSDYRQQSLGNGKDLFKVLGLHEGASTQEVRKAYKKLARQYHPDRNKDESAAEKFVEVQEAHEILSDEKKRREYMLTRPPNARNQRYQRQRQDEQRSRFEQQFERRKPKRHAPSFLEQALEHLPSFLIGGLILYNLGFFGWNEAEEENANDLRFQSLQYLLKEIDITRPRKPVLVVISGVSNFPLILRLENAFQRDPIFFRLIDHRNEAALTGLSEFLGDVSLLKSSVMIIHVRKRKLHTLDVANESIISKSLERLLEGYLEMKNF